MEAKHVTLNKAEMLTYHKSLVVIKDKCMIYRSDVQ